MKNSWPNALNIILIVIIILLFTGTLDTQKPIKVSEQIFGFMKQTNARAALIIGDDERIVAINKNGDLFKGCDIGPNGKHPQCKCIEFIFPPFGKIQELCWEEESPLVPE